MGEALNRLSPKHRHFVLEFLANGGVGTKAGKASGCSSPPRTLARADVKAAIAEMLGQVQAKLELNAERVLAELEAQAFGDIGELAAWAWGGQPPEGEQALMGVTLKDSRTLPPHIRRLVKKVKATEDGPEITLRDSTPALLTLAKYFKLISDAPLVGVTLEEALALANERAAKKAEGEGGK